MIDNRQCQTHTRTPWGSSPHRYDPRLRYLVMGLLCASVLAVFLISLVFVGNSAVKAYSSSSSSSSSSDDDDGNHDLPSSTKLLPSSTTGINTTELNHTTYTSDSVTVTVSLQTLLQTTITVPIGDAYTALQTTVTVPFDGSSTADIG
ncbi:hypothetical protein BBK36DRAFT_7106 [Trichoderma citrinoviride]|uniref:Uncharacterized protein n=1 Tax=Trichoderma citrinoviride TaxID=58853 RepID=A0A2T4B3G7_9HYPO|nr:hypothetical protein BBK36DRAFT_7106 [Trichoderma citrinoviride]PTB63867.1 hypothetical protein BBK36DRAFT_7106 [Trichoderma citrinoviride]